MEGPFGQLFDCTVADLAARQVAARRAREQPGPALAVEHADDVTDLTYKGHKAFRVQPEPWRLFTTVDDLEHRPARPFLGA